MTDLLVLALINKYRSYYSNNKNNDKDNCSHYPIGIYKAADKQKHGL